MRPFRISKLCPMVNKGLLDSGATHPLRAKRKGERLQIQMQKKKIKLQNKKVSLRKIRKKIQRMTRKKKFKKEEK